MAFYRWDGHPEREVEDDVEVLINGQSLYGQAFEFTDEQLRQTVLDSFANAGQPVPQVDIRRLLPHRP